MRDPAWFAAELARLDATIEQQQLLQAQAEALRAQSRRLRAQSQELHERSRQLAQHIPAPQMAGAEQEREV